MKKYVKKIFFYLLAYFLIVFVILTYVDTPFCQTKSSRLEKIMDIAGVRAGMFIGEIGAGHGSLTFPMAKRVGENGKIYANDIDRESLAYIDEKGVQNIETVPGLVEDPAFPEKNLDIIIMKDVFHDLENPLSMLENIKKYLKPGMVLVVAETNPSKIYKDSRPQTHHMSKEQIISIVKKSSYKLEHLDTSLQTYDIYVLKIDKEKESNVWSNWLKEFQLEVNSVKEYEKNKDISTVKKRIAWERVLNSYRDNNPNSGKEEQLRELINEKIYSLKKFEKQSAATNANKSKNRKPTDFPGTQLRSEYQSISEDEISGIFKRLGFKGKLQARSGDFQNQFVPITNNGDKVVIDNATGLMWHQGGSTETMDFFTAQEWIDDMNIRRYAGYSDWRLPTVEEVASLIEMKKTNEGMRIDPLFSKLQWIIWTGDRHYPGRSFFINIYSAAFGTNLKIFNKCWVRPVRSIYW